MPGAAVALAAAEGVVLFVACQRQFASWWEVHWGSLFLAPAVVLHAGAAGLTAAALVVGAMDDRKSVRWLAAGAAAVLCAWLGYELSFGRHFALWWRRVGFVALLSTTAAVSLGWGGPFVSRRLRRAPRQVLWLGLVAALVLLTVNRFVLVRLYAPFHLALSFSSCVAAGIAGLGYHAWRSAGSDQPVPRRWTGLRVLALALIAAIAAVLPSSRKLSGFDNFRWIVSENAPLLGQALRLATWVAPPLELTPDGGAAEEHRAPRAAALGLEDRDVLLITVDALRADHVGAYGYARPTTPNLDRLARDGVRFERAYCPTPHTSYSVTSLLTGKYMRPLLLQGLGADSETWADLLRRYGYRTAAFYPPAIFFIDTERFQAFDDRQLGFEYQKREFLEGEPRVAQVRHYLSSLEPRQRTFVWLHLFGPHEPYESHPDFDFGNEDEDRYDSEIRATDETIGKVVAAFRERSPDGIVVVTADHGEEFGEHGGRYHGSSVYEEQVRVPLIVSAPGLAPRVVEPPVQTIDLLPTVLSALHIPVRPRIRGRDLTPWLAAEAGTSSDEGFAFAETDDQAMLAEGSHRLICLRRVGACQLFDIQHDPAQKQDVSRERRETLEAMRERLRRLSAEHGRYEVSGARAEGLRLPGALLRGVAGDVDAAPEIAALLDDADVQVRRKAARVLFDLSASSLPSVTTEAPAGAAYALRGEVATPLRLALQRDEDHEVRAFSALALTRLGEGAALTRELLESGEVGWRRWAALALAESGDARGMKELLAWWMDKQPRPFEVSTQLVAAFARAKEKDAVWPLTLELPDVRLRPHIIRALAAIGDDSAINPLVAQFRREPYQTNRTALARALLTLGAGPELAAPLRRWLGVGQPLENGLEIARRAKVLEQVGGPSDNDLRRLRQNANLGQMVQIVVPKTGNGRRIRVLARVRNHGSDAVSLRVAVPQRGVFSFDSEGKLKTSRKIPELDVEKQLTLSVPPSPEVREIHGLVPPSMGLEPGKSSYVVVFAEHGMEVDSVAFVPLQDEVSAGAAPAEE